MKRFLLACTILAVSMFAVVAQAQACYIVSSDAGSCINYYELCSFHADGTGGLYIAHRGSICYS